MEPAVEPDHPERHDLWGARRNSARFSAHRKYLCRTLRLCARPETLAKHFHL